MCVCLLKYLPSNFLTFPNISHLSFSFSLPGCGLGMVSILLDKLSVCRSVIATDGDDDTMDLLRENIELTGNSDTVCVCACQYV